MFNFERLEVRNLAIEFADLAKGSSRGSKNDDFARFIASMLSGLRKSLFIE